MDKNILPSSVLLVLTLCITYGCGTRKAYEDETFNSSSKSVLTRAFSDNCLVVLHAARNVLLSEGYRLEKVNEQQYHLDMSKERQIEDDISSHIDFQFNAMSCAEQSSLVGVTAIETQIKSAEKRNYTEVSVGPIFTMPIPAGHEQTMSKTLGETIYDKAFYEQFFTALAQEISLARTMINDSDKHNAEIIVKPKTQTPEAKPIISASPVNSSVTATDQPIPSAVSTPPSIEAGSGKSTEINETDKTIKLPAI
jgi:hypothetical protein